jgi:hypothetical protein
MTPISWAASTTSKEEFSGTVEQTVRLSPIYRQERSKP